MGVARSSDRVFLTPRSRWARREDVTMLRRIAVSPKIGDAAKLRERVRRVRHPAASRFDLEAAAVPVDFHPAATWREQKQIREVLPALRRAFVHDLVEPKLDAARPRIQRVRIGSDSKETGRVPILRSAGRRAQLRAPHDGNEQDQFPHSVFTFAAS
jgi:hypothetical protein